MKNERLGFFDYVMAFVVILLMFMAASCTPEDDIFVIQEPTLELDGRLPLDTNGYYHLELRQDVHQTIHRITGTVGNILEGIDPLKVSWDSNLTWTYQGEDVSTSNQASYVVDGKVHNVIAPINTMVGDTLILIGTIREHLVTDRIQIVLE